MEELEAIVFDLDGVISRTERIHSEAKKQVLEDLLGREVDLSVEDITREYAGVSSEIFFEENLERYSNENHTRKDFERAAEQKRATVRQRIEEGEVEPVPGSAELIEQLGTEHKLAVASSSPESHIESVLQALDLQSYFDGYVSAKQVEKGKPAGDVFRAAAELVGAKSQNCLAIEDSRTGIEAAKNAGMVCIGFGNHGKETGADHVTESLETLSVQEIEEIYSESR